MHRVVTALAAFVFLVSVPAALADGPTPYVSQGGLGVLAPNGKTRYVAVPAGNFTAIERVIVHGGNVFSWTLLNGYWGIPAPTPRAEGISRDGTKLIVASAGRFSHSRFAILDAHTLRELDHFSLNGNFAYDALSPDASKLYLIQHVDQSNSTRYVVRAYDPGNHTLLPGRIADRTQRSWVMEGSAVTRATSPDARWVYTLYQRPGGYPIIHALDTVRGAAHCTGLPWTGDQSPLWTLRLAVHGTTLSIDWKSGKPWLTMNTENWGLTRMHPSAFAWRRLLVAAGGALAAAVLVLARRRQHPREAAAVPL